MDTLPRRTRRASSARRPRACSRSARTEASEVESSHGKPPTNREKRPVILRECSCQPDETLEEHFSSLDRKYVKGEGTLALIRTLKEYPDERVVYGLTQIDRLILLSQDDYTTPWWVIVTSHGAKDFEIDCRMPENQSPWKGARLIGKTKKLDRAVAMVVTAMTVSRGWNDEMGEAPIGLDEIVEESLSLFRFKDAEQECRALMGGWENECRLDPASGKEVTLTVLAKTGDEELLAYRHDASQTARWGLIRPQMEVLSEELDWHFWMDDAFCRSDAWEGAPPPEIAT